ncbi:unnamed protein product [Angiostrongylus costaricensis]|uniref:tRNA-synt_1d domain-containing protein n=1 Tax=Angiostrongylus costaricensis TaxID=334426 RepID=A0A0R3PS79_ANGCS|nr:unnamed protein product [Angiostrongylus costaricensis]
MLVSYPRSTITGNSICRLWAYLALTVFPLFYSPSKSLFTLLLLFANLFLYALRVNRIGDWGTQFEVLVGHVYYKYSINVNEPPPISDDLQIFRKVIRMCSAELPFRTPTHAFFRNDVS